jgi:hypothetical protein
MIPNPLEEGKVRDEEAFDAILVEYQASRNL